MESGQGATNESAGHSRTASQARRQALPRRSTKGPLDSEDPLAKSSSPHGSPSRRSAQTLNVDNQRPLSHSPSRSPGRQPQKKSFAYLLRPDNFIELDQKDVPEPFRSHVPHEPTQDDVNTAITEGRFRTAATLAGSLLKSKSDPSDYDGIFTLLQTRFACLQFAGLHNVAAHESKVLQDLNAPIYRDAVSGRHLAPWTLRVLSVRLQAIGLNDWRRGIMGYYDLAREARLEARRAEEDSRMLWEARLQDLGIHIANALIEMDDLESAIRFLQFLPEPSDASNKERLGLVYLQTGDVESAERCMAAITDGANETRHQLLRALCDLAKGDFAAALENFSAIPSDSDGDLGVLAARNRAACLVYLGKMHEARTSLEDMAERGSSSADSLYNLATLFDLCTSDSSQLKASLATRTAQHKPRPGQSWERSNLDFKM